MSESSSRPGRVIPAQLSFLAIYNPSLGASDETLHDQVVFYSSKASRARSRPKANGEGGDEGQHEEENEKLRQIGLAQGMVEFAKSFSDGEAVDSVETEKSRIVLHELENGWWILASIDLTRLPSSTLNESKSSDVVNPTSVQPIEYSAREVCPPTLLLQQLIDAHGIFLLHHGSSLEELYERTPRPKFCSTLNRFWARFIWNWDVLLHANPAVDIFSGLKLAGGGELGIGVGEEDWGSGEREVLEDFVQRTEGLVDLVVSRFGEPSPEATILSKSLDNSLKPLIPTSHGQQWLGTSTAPSPSDGVIFSGVGALERTSLRNVSGWIEWIYSYGEDAYGVREHPNSAHRRKRRKGRSQVVDHETKGTKTNMPIATPKSTRMPSRHGKPGEKSSREQQGESPIGIPPPIISAAAESLSKATAPARTSRNHSRTRTETQSEPLPDVNNASSSTETLMKYLTLGVYGSSWGISSARPAVHRRVSDILQQSGSAGDADRREWASMRHLDPKAEPSADEEEGFGLKRGKTSGRFIIGLQGNLEDEEAKEYLTELTELTESGTDGEHESGNWNSRTMIRTLHVALVKPRVTERASDHDDRDIAKQLPMVTHDRLRVVVYVHQPFIFTFLFELHTDKLAMPSFYQSLHHQLSPLQKPLLASTSPGKVSERLWNASTLHSTASTSNGQPIYDLLYDPSNLTVHTSIPNMPEPGTAAAEGLDLKTSPWSRVEALSVHTQILNTYISTRRHSSEVERTCKTSRGWWVVWMRLPHAPTSSERHSNEYREAFLVRKASDYVAPGARKSSGRFGRDVSGSDGGSGWGPGKLAEGIGIDTRKYIEGLLSLNR
ncbi:MAG: hypothetical protein M1830_002610 [Pleopsidium flavum]|nr:MAG: hypothetical protein M1830_002610 [Pleopsidium flavum]